MLSADVQAGGPSLGSAGSVPGSWQVAPTTGEPAVVVSLFNDRVEPLTKYSRTRVDVVDTSRLPATGVQVVDVQLLVELAAV